MQSLREYLPLGTRISNMKLSKSCTNISTSEEGRKGWRYNKDKRIDDQKNMKTLSNT